MIKKIKIVCRDENGKQLYSALQHFSAVREISIEQSVEIILFHTLSCFDLILNSYICGPGDVCENKN